jgi:octaprenyl-diphosphate synthase
MQSLEFQLIEQIRSRVPIAFEISAHILESGGKRIRPQLTIVAARMGGYTGPDAIKLSGAIECIHTATLLHDDVVDHAKHRRGKPSANTVWSNEMCVLGGDFILAKAFSALTDIGNLRILKIVSGATERLSEGELFQMANIGNLDFTEDDYLQVITDKTAVLMEAACRGGAILGNLPPEEEAALAEFGFNLGLAFQMTDDVIDYRSDLEVMGKRPGKDLEEGKLTLPLILGLQRASPEERDHVSGLIHERRVEEEELAWVRAFLEKTGALDETLARSRRYLELATACLIPFPQSEEKETLAQLAARISKRTY